MKTNKKYLLLHHLDNALTVLMFCKPLSYTEDELYTHLDNLATAVREYLQEK